MPSIFDEMFEDGDVSCPGLFPSGEDIKGRHGGHHCVDHSVTLRGFQQNPWIIYIIIRQDTHEIFDGVIVDI